MKANFPIALTLGQKEQPCGASSKDAAPFISPAPPEIHPAPAAALGLSVGSQLRPTAEGAPGEEEEQAQLGRSSPRNEGRGQGCTEVTASCSAAPGRELLTA